MNYFVYFIFMGFIFSRYEKLWNVFLRSKCYLWDNSRKYPNKLQNSIQSSEKISINRARFANKQLSVVFSNLTKSIVKILYKENPIDTKIISKPQLLTIITFITNLIKDSYPRKIIKFMTALRQWIQRDVKALNMPYPVTIALI